MKEVQVLFAKKRAIVLDTNMPIYWAGKLKGFLKYLKKIKGPVFVPWIVQIELSTMTHKTNSEDEIWKKGTHEQQKKLEKYLLKFPDKKRRAREKRNKAAARAYPFVQGQIEKGNWKLVGKNTDLEPYLKGIIKIKQKIKKPDAKILASCLLLADKYKFKQVVLITRDKGLGKTASEFGIEVEKALSEIIKN